LNILGIDFEDWYHPQLIQSHIQTKEKKPSVINGIDKILDFLRKHDVYATFFVVGELLEIACFSYAGTNLRIVCWGLSWWSSG